MGPSAKCDANIARSLNGHCGQRIADAPRKICARPSEKMTPEGDGERPALPASPVPARSSLLVTRPYRPWYAASESMSRKSQPYRTAAAIPRWAKSGPRLLLARALARKARNAKPRSTGRAGFGHDRLLTDGGLCRLHRLGAAVIVRRTHTKRGAGRHNHPVRSRTDLGNRPSAPLAQRAAAARADEGAQPSRKKIRAPNSLLRRRIHAGYSVRGLPAPGLPPFGEACFSAPPYSVQLRGVPVVRVPQLSTTEPRSRCGLTPRFNDASFAIFLKTCAPGNDEG